MNKMNLGVISDQLPTYPNTIQGELRIILQTKDIFLVCYKHLEEYRRLVNEQNRLITKEFVQEQLQIGEDEIAELKMELQDAESRLGVRLKHNELLADHLASLGFASLESGASVRHLALCRSPQMRKNMLAQRQGGIGSGRYSEPRPPTHMIDNIALAISEIHQEVRAKVKPLLDYYRDLFYLQLHFSLVLGQVCNYCMPLVTENIGLIDRIFFWSERPEFDLVRRAGDISDRLKEIYTRAQTVLGVLAESVRFLQSKVELQKTLEQRFHERLDEQQKTKDKILREVHTTKQNMDMLEEENDRLVGSLVKVDPTFVDSRHFYELAEGGNLMGAKKPGVTKDSGQNNAAEKLELNNESAQNQINAEFEMESRKNSVQFRDRTSKNSEKIKTPSFENMTFDENNNKAISVVADPPSEVLIKHSPNKKSKENINKSNRETKSKSTVRKNLSAEKSHPRSKNIVQHANGETSVELSELSSSGKVTPKSSKYRAGSESRPRSRSKSQRRDPTYERKRGSPSRESKKRDRRAVSAEKEERKERSRKTRSKSSVGTRNSEPNGFQNPHSHRQTPINDELKSFKLADSLDTQTNVSSNVVAPLSLKSRLLGKTRDLLDAALNRSSKSNSLGQVSRTVGETDSSLATGRMDHEEGINEGVTSVSSFASLLVPDSPLGEPGLMLGSHLSPMKQLRKNNRRVLESNKGKIRSSKHRKSLVIDAFQNQQLPALSSDVLLIETPTDIQSNSGYQISKYHVKSPKRRSSKTRRTTSNNLGAFLVGTEFESSPTNSNPSPLPSLA